MELRRARLSAAKHRAPHLRAQAKRLFDEVNKTYAPLVERRTPGEPLDAHEFCTRLRRVAPDAYRQLLNFSTTGNEGRGKNGLSKTEPKVMRSVFAFGAMQQIARSTTPVRERAVGVTVDNLLRAAGASRACLRVVSMLGLSPAPEKVDKYLDARNAEAVQARRASFAPGGRADTMVRNRSHLPPVLETASERLASGTPLMCGDAEEVFRMQADVAAFVAGGDDGGKQ